MKAYILPVLAIVAFLASCIILGGYGLLLGLFFGGCAVAARLDREQVQPRQK